MTGRAARECEGAARALCRAGGELHELRLLAGRAGNLSVRVPGAGDVLVTPRGAHKGRLRPEDLVRLDPSAPDPEAVRKATSELSLHLEAYAADPRARAVVHVHGPALTAIGLRGIDLADRLPEVADVLGGTALVPFLPSGSAELGREVGRAVRSGAATLLLRRHGAVAVAPELEEAVLRLELGEVSACAVLLAESTGMEMDLRRLTTLVGTLTARARREGGGPVGESRD